MNLLKSIENALTLYGKDIKTERERTKKRLETYQEKYWLNEIIIKKKNPTTPKEAKLLSRELKILETAISHLKSYPSDYAKLYHELLYYRYLYKSTLNKSALMARLFIEERTYYRRKNEALSLLALVLTLDET